MSRPAPQKSLLRAVKQAAIAEFLECDPREIQQAGGG